MKTGKDYQGVLRRDVECEEFLYDEHFTFVETLPWSMKRNPRVYNGRYISVTRQDNGNLRPNFSAWSAMPSACITNSAWHWVAW